ncbi:hypothetical protein FN976_26945 [Caenimonas sedimenti]|uniref:Uncharacterized protein n=1 Tax=Caenimonas sedimenti TaxID=2596921 RepID=A0A562ZFA9_9BURK|nr:hypothetical protein [Caenimonas sedimenti]TWO66019.1 hypothetical protein FN976_26945 [Caenimonas sedimenti]
MELQYLLFDFTDEEGGACSFDAMASVLPAGLVPLLGEVEAVLGWAHREFGAPSAEGGGAEWDFDLHAADERDVPLAISYDVPRARVILAAAPGRVTLTLPVTGSRLFGAAFRDAFPDPD